MNIAFWLVTIKQQVCAVFLLCQVPREQHISLWCCNWSNSFVWHVYWLVNIPIRKRLMFDIFWQKILHSDWSIWCNLFSEPDETLLHLSADFWSNNFCLTDLKVRFWYATMNAWIQIWVQGEMCGNNTLKIGMTHIMYQFPLKQYW